VEVRVRRVRARGSRRQPRGDRCPKAGSSEGLEEKECDERSEHGAARHL
jgi:hypothetical protein